MRLSQKSKRWFLLPLLCFNIIPVFAQNGYKYATTVQKIDTPGFYKINLQPEFVAKSEAGLYDLRLMDPKGTFMPFVRDSNLPVNQRQQFIVFPEVANTGKADTGTSIVVKNKATQPIGRIWLKLKNTAVIRTLNLSGSDDLKHWFAISEGVPLEQADLNSSGAYVQSFTFPASNYHYFKIIVNDKNKTPIKFLEAGIYISQQSTSSYLPILPVVISQRDSDKTSYITIKLNDKYLVNKLQLSISKPKYYKRSVSVYDAGGKIPVLISESELISGNTTDLLLSAKTNRFTLIIKNADNLPLNISSIAAYQANQYIVSYLDAHISYYLLTGKAADKEPNYDLKFFTDSLRGPIPEIGHGPVFKNIAYTIGPMVVSRDYTFIIWAAIIVSLLLLSLLTWKMVGEVDKKRTK